MLCEHSSGGSQKTDAAIMENKRPSSSTEGAKNSTLRVQARLKFHCISRIVIVPANRKIFIKILMSFFRRNVLGFAGLLTIIDISRREF